MTEDCKKYDLEPTDLRGIEIENNLEEYQRIFYSPDTAYVVIENIAENPKMEIFYKAVPFNKRILVALEPPTVLPLMYSEATLSKFAKVLTRDNSLVDNQRFF